MKSRPYGHNGYSKPVHRSMSFVGTVDVSEIPLGLSFFELVLLKGWCGTAT